MAVYAVGDLQGCHDEFRRLLDRLDFDPAADRLWLVGDLVNRGPRSLATLRHVHALRESVDCVLGNHDLHLLATAFTGRPADSGLQEILAAPDRDELIDWLRRQPLAHYDSSMNTLLVHAGVDAHWTVARTLALAAEVEAVLGGNEPQAFLRTMYGREPDRWHDELAGTDRLRYIVNCLTRSRYVTADGRLDLDAKLAPAEHPDLTPWFRVADRATADTRIVFGHWSTLGLLREPRLLGLDTGCVWGGTLTAIRLDAAADPVVVPSAQPRRF